MFSKNKPKDQNIKILSVFKNRISWCIYRPFLSDKVKANHPKECINQSNSKTTKDISPQKTSASINCKVDSDINWNY